MRRALLKAVAAAPLLAAIAGAAWGACPGGPGPTGGSDVELPSGCTITPSATQPGVTLNSNNNVTIDSGATISNTDVSNSVGVLVNGGNSGSVDNEGAISLSMSYTATDTNSDGFVDGAFATGTNRYGIQITGGPFTGTVTNGSTGSITIQGNDSYGIWVDTTGSIIGDLVDSGSVSVLGNQTVGVLVNGPIQGNLNVSGSINATGVGAQGLVTTAPVSGALTIQNAITSTAYRSTTAPISSVVLDALTPDELQQGGPAVSIGGSVALGVTIGPPSSATSGTTTTTVSAGDLSVFGDAPALKIGASNQSVSIGSNVSDPTEPYSVVIGGSVNASGVYEPKATPSLGGPVNVTSILLGSQDETGLTDLIGGLHVQNGGSVVADSFSASAAAIHVTSGSTVPVIANDGNIQAVGTINSQTVAPVTFNGAIAGNTLTVSASSGTLQVGETLSGGGILSGTTITASNGAVAGGTSYTVNRAQGVPATGNLTATYTPQIQTVVIDDGASVPSLINNRSIAAYASNTASGLTVNTAAITDYSGTLGNITNTGSISAVTSATSNLFTTYGDNTAIDVRSSTAGVNITQQQATPAVITGSISGDVLSVKSGASTAVGVGQTITGPGIAAGTVISELSTPASSSSGLTYLLNISQTVASESINVGTPTAVFTGSISGTKLSVSSVTSGVLTTGQTISGPGIAPGTTITADGTGTGGVGSYTVDTSQSVASETVDAAVTPSITGDILLGAGHNVLDIESGRFTGALTELSGQHDLSITVNNATVNLTKAEAHPIASLNVGSTGVLVVKLDPTFALGGTAPPTAIFDTTASGGAAIFADGAKVGVSLDSIQPASNSTYVFVHTGGAGDLTVGALDNTLLEDAPYLYTATAAQSGGDLDISLTQKTAAQLGFNASEAAAYPAIYAAIQKDTLVGNVIAAQTTRAGLVSLYDQLVPDQGIGTFDALESATQKISNMVEQSPDNGTHSAGGSLWLQEVNQRVTRQTNAYTLGSTAKVFGLVGGYEIKGAGGGALGLTLAYMNIDDEGVATPVGGRLVTDVLEGGAYYRRSIGGLRLSVRGAGGYAWFDDHAQFLTTGASESATGAWNGVFVDGHASAAYELHLSRFYIRPEVSVDYLYLNENAHSTTGAANQAINTSIARRTSKDLTAAAILTFGAQYGRDTWFRPEVFGGYREVVSGQLGDTVATINGGTPFTLTPGSTKGGWLTVGFALKGGTDLSYVAVEGDADFRQKEQRFDVYLSGRSMF
jgi:hypothetical protein